MGAKISSNVATEIQNVTNDIFQSSNEVCISNCQSVFSGNTVIISGENVTGTIGIGTQCSASAECAMQQQLDNQVQTILQALAQQTNAFSGFSPLNPGEYDNQNNTLTISQAIRNTITQAMSSMCQANSETIVSNNTIVIKDGTSGNIFLSANGGSANANCVMNNVARTTLFNQAVAQSDQTNKDIDGIVAIFMAIAAIIIIVAIVALIIIGPATIAKVSGSKKGEGEGNGNDAELAQLLSETGNGSVGEMG